MTVELQALWFRSDKWSEADAVAWAADHDFISDTVRTRTDDDGNVTHWIIPQFDPPADAEWVTLADDFPDGISASAVITQDKEINMDPIIKTGEQSAEDPFTFIMSTEDKDRDGDVIRASGWDIKDFKKNPVALFGHSHRDPIGTWENVRVEGKKLIGDLKLAAKGTSEFIDTLHKLIEQRILRAVSVGFSPIEYDILPDKSGIDFQKTALHECSLVSVPANQNALRIKAANIIPEDLQEVFLGDAKRERGRSTRAQILTEGTRSKSVPYGVGT